MLYQGVFLATCLILAANGQDNSCYNYDTDLSGTDLVNGLDHKFNTAEECQQACVDNYPAASMSHFIEIASIRPC